MNVGEPETQSAFIRVICQNRWFSRIFLIFADYSIRVMCIVYVVRWYKPVASVGVYWVTDNADDTNLQICVYPPNQRQSVIQTILKICVYPPNQRKSAIQTKFFLTPNPNCSIIPIYPKKEVDIFSQLFYNCSVKPYMETRKNGALQSRKQFFSKKDWQINATSGIINTS